MSLDASYQAIPAGCGLIDLARRDVAVGEILSFVPHWFRDGFRRGPRPWPEAERLCGVLRELAAQHPGLEGRNYFLNSRWDALHYLLSANRREEHAGEGDTTLDHAVRGATEIAGHVRATQGAPVKYVTPQEVARVASLLDAMSHATLRRRYDPVRMEAAGVYKFWADRPEERPYIAGHFDGFRAFYREAARHGEGVIVCLD